MQKLRIILKQHTPLIHFQHDEGATIRATELKPKLDKYLVKNFREKLNFFIKKTSDKEDFLDFKIRITCETEPKLTSIEKPFPCFFAAMGEDYRKNPKYFSFTTGNVTLDFFCFDKIILEVIELSICDFFAVNNFGTRQSKGFGSFYPVKNFEKYKEITSILDKNLHFKYDFKIPDESIFLDIDTIYKLMKSGFNFPDHPKRDDNKIDYDAPKGIFKTYIKSFLFKYFLDKNIGNEKRFIKENFFSRNVQIDNDRMDKKYVRALLGVTDNIEFRGKERYGKISIKSDIVERYKSPILFKIVDELVYIINEDTILPKTTFTFSKSTSNGNSFDKKLDTVTEKIDFQDFFLKYTDYFNESKKEFLKSFSMIKTARNPPIAIKNLKESFERINLKYTPHV